MLLAIDIGNTNTVVGVFDGDTLRDHFRVASAHNLTSDEAGLFVTGLLERMAIPVASVDSTIIASVVPQLDRVYERMSKRFFNCDPIIVKHDIPLPIRVAIEQPEQVGADRIANAVAVNTLYDGPAIVVDFGTATTFDVLDAKDAYIGGVIIPGPETSLSELSRRAAKLFEVRFEKPTSVVGKSTAHALRSGMFYGTVGQVDFIIDKIIEETGFAHPTVVATGGLASGMERHTRHIRYVLPTLTLEGLRLIAAHIPK